jgi:LytR cell envelope-related transcriptional attenuator
MTEPAPPGRPNSHRASTGASRALGRLAAPLVAVGVVVVVILLLIWINGRSDDSSSSAVVSPPSASAAATPAAPPSASPTARPRPTPTSSPRRHTPAPRRSTHPVAAPTSPPASAAPAFAPVEVLNNSRISGLAHHVAAEVEGRGWTISDVGNLRGRIADTTVYYPDGGFAAAQHLQSEFGSIHRLLPQSEAGLHSDGLVLVITRFWTD